MANAIINIYGQHAHQSLMNISTQREIVDQFAEHKDDLDSIDQLFTDWRKQKEQFENLSSNSTDIQSTIELLRYQVEELDQLNLEPNEIDSLEQKTKTLSKR